MEFFESVEDPDRAGRCIGEWLGLPQSAVEEIKKGYQRPTQRKEAYLDTYTHQHPWPSWKKVAETLWICDLNRQADKVKNIYVQGMYVHLL